MNARNPGEPFEQLVKDFYFGSELSEKEGILGKFMEKVENLTTESPDDLPYPLLPISKGCKSALSGDIPIPFPFANRLTSETGKAERNQIRKRRKVHLSPCLVLSNFIHHSLFFNCLNYFNGKSSTSKVLSLVTEINDKNIMSLKMYLTLTSSF